MQLFLFNKENKQTVKKKITPKLELPLGNSLHQPVTALGDLDPRDLLPVMPGCPVIFCWFTAASRQNHVTEKVKLVHSD